MEQIEKNRSLKFKYMMLSRLVNECKAFVGYKSIKEEAEFDCRYHNLRNCWGLTIESQIEYVKNLWESIPEDLKPEWTSWEEINELESLMYQVESN